MQSIEEPALRERVVRRVRESMVQRYGRTDRARPLPDRMKQLQVSLLDRGFDVEIDVTGELPEDFAMEVVMRMLRMETVQKDILEKVEQTLRTEFMSNLARTSRRDAHEMMAEIFNHLDRSTEERFMMALEDRAVDAAERIRTLMFTFEDLAKLDPGSLQSLMRNIDKGRLAVALKGATDQMREFFFGNMSERAARIMREDMEIMGPVRVREVDEAQQAIVGIAKQLAETGEIILVDTRDADDELVF